MKKYKIVALVSLLLVAVLAFSSCGAKNTANADGKVGDIEWEYISSDKTLKLSGSGDIENYDSSSETPWASALPYLEKIEIGEGITAIGNKAFYGSAKLEKVNIPSTVTKIGDLAFAYSASVKEISLPDLLASVGKGAFEGCSSLENITLGANLTYLGERAFAFCSSLKNVSVLGKVDIKSETFYNCVSLEKLIRNKDISKENVALDAFKNTDFTYEKSEAPADPNATVTVTIEYVYEDGTKAAESKVITDLKVGVSTYSEPSPAIDGFVADRETVSGIASTSDTTEKVVYKKAAADTELETETEAETEAVAPGDEKKSGVGGYVALGIMVVVIAALCIGGLKLKKAEKQRQEKEKNQNKAKNRKQ